ncbi:MAG: DUF5719 family protein [Actinomycetota bacterium]
MTPRERVLGAILLSVAVIAAGIALEKIGPRSHAAERVPSDVSTVWFCPHGGGEDWRAYLWLANPTEREVEVRVVTYRSGLSPTGFRTTVPAMSHRSVEVPADRLAAGSAAEFFGAAGAVGMAVHRRLNGLAAEPCTPRTSDTWFVPEGSTVRGRDDRLVVLNPLRQEVVVDVALTTERKTISPSALSGIVLGPQRAVAFNLNEYALGKRSLAATVVAHLGEVAVAGFGLAAGSTRAILGQMSSGLRSFLPATGGSGVSQLSLQVPDQGVVPLVARAQGEDRLAEALKEVELRGPAARAFNVKDLLGGLFVDAPESEVPFVAGRRLSVERVDEASVGGRTVGSQRWLALPALGPAGGAARLVVQNAGEGDATVSVTLLGEKGSVAPPELADVVVPAGRTVILHLSDLVGDRAVSALVEASAGKVVVSQVGRTETAFAVGLGIALPTG